MASVLPKDTPYLIPVGVADYSRAASLNLIFDPHSKNFFPFDKVNSGDNILFAGCGNGMLVVDIAKKLKDRNVKIVAFDISEQQIKCAREYAEKEAVNGIDWKIGDIRNLNEFKGLFNIVHVRFVLNHLADAKQATKELCSTLADNGIFIGEELAGYDVDVSTDSKEYTDAVRAWEQGVILQHAKQRSNISFADRMPAIIRKTGLIVERELKPKPVASTPEQKNLLPASMKSAPLILSPYFLSVVPVVQEKLEKIRDSDGCSITFKHFTQIEARKY